MDRLIAHYVRKLGRAGLADPDVVLLGAQDELLQWNRRDPRTAVLEPIVRALNLQALLFAPPCDPYRSVMEWLCERADASLRPQDTETRTFLHELPIVRRFDAASVVAALKKRKGVLLPGHGILTLGTVTPEQAYVTYSSICFALLVLFFSKLLPAARDGGLPDGAARILATAFAAPAPEEPAALARGPFATAAEVLAAMDEAGRALVRGRWVDSIFGNLSCRLGETLYISQTGSALDELPGCIDAVALDGFDCRGITASSEWSAHRRISAETGARAILHGHPPFTVILSLDCDRTCPDRGQCHKKCPESRRIAGLPIVPGEIGTGPHGLCHTVPAALIEHRGVIVHGHGIFATGRVDFREALATIAETEKCCREITFDRLHAFR